MTELCKLQGCADAVVNGVKGNLGAIAGGGIITRQLQVSLYFTVFHTGYFIGMHAVNAALWIWEMPPRKILEN